MKKGSNDKATRFISISTIIVLLICIFFAYTQFEDYCDTSIQYQQMYQNSIQDRNIFLQSIIQENESKAKCIMNLFAQEVENDIKDAYGNNKSQLEYDILNPSKDSKLNNILDDNLSQIYINEDTESNKPFVASMNDILWSRNPLLGKSTKTNFYSWEGIGKYHYNPSLAQQAINAIKNPNYSYDNIIYWQTQPYTNNNIYILNSMDMNSLLTMYNMCGVDSFKNCELLVPSYITKNGDIFDNHDFNSLGQRQSDYKIILVMKVNIYDAIKPYLGDLQYYSNQVTNMQYKIKHYQTNKVYTMVATLIFSVVLILGSGYIQYRLTKEDEIESDKRGQYEKD